MGAELPWGQYWLATHLPPSGEAGWASDDPRVQYHPGSHIDVIFLFFIFNSFQNQVFDANYLHFVDSWLTPQYKYFHFL
jgi:hypothetical protein